MAAAGLFVAGLLAMLGIVLMVNPTRFGTTGAFVGVALLALGSTWTLIAFRGRGRRDGL